MDWISGGVCAAKGFYAAGMHAGIKYKDPAKKDLALIVSEKTCTAAATFTTNAVKAAPVLYDMELIKKGCGRAVIVNSGIANACAPNEMENAVRMGKAAAKAIGCSPEEVYVSSTGVIGMELPAAVIEEAVPALYEMLDGGEAGSDAAAAAIMTTDTVKKEAAVEIVLSGKPVRIGAITKGSGMIHPNMGTMLCYVTTDAAISAELLHKALLAAVKQSFNRISVDGDTSTNDTCLILANGMAGNDPVTEENDDYAAFSEALSGLTKNLAVRMASDGEGARHLITCTVSEAESEEKAEIMARSVISSTLTKAAVFGADANWGRVMCAMGYAGVPFDPKKADVAFASAAGKVTVGKAGCGIAFDEDLAKEILTEHDVEILISLNEGDAACTCWGCDITYEYIKINGDYRT